MLTQNKKISTGNFEDKIKIKPLGHPDFNSISLGEKYMMWHKFKGLYDEMQNIETGGKLYKILRIKENETNEIFYEQDFKHQVIFDYFSALVKSLIESADALITNQVYAAIIANSLNKTVFFVKDNYAKKQNMNILKNLPKVNLLAVNFDEQKYVLEFLSHNTINAENKNSDFLSSNPYPLADIEHESYVPKSIDNAVKLAFICDENYAMMTAVAIQSAIENKKANSFYEINVVGFNLSNLSKQRFVRMEETGVKINIINIDNLKKFEDINQSRYITPTALLKFDLPSIFADDEKILYLDGDVFVQGDLSEFYHTNLQNKYALVVKDIYYLSNPELRAKHSVCNNENYFNSGVLLLNLHKMREDNIEAKLLDWRKNNGTYFMDQDALNAILAENVAQADVLHNFLAFYPQLFKRKTLENFYKIKLPKDVIKLYKKALILHYPGQTKPYMADMGYLTQEFMKYLQKTEFRELANVQSLNLFNDYKQRFSKYGWQLEHKNNHHMLSKKNLTLIGSSDNMLWTAWGVFLEDEYAFYDSEKYVMIDIGFNLGFASLRLAQEKHIAKIYAFEPFTPTYLQGLENLKANPDLARKIEVFNYGLSNKNTVLDLHYNPELNGSMSTVNDRFSDGELVRAEVKNASDVLKNILSAHKEKVFLKIDCEGAEKEIIMDLSESGILRKIDLIIMEWHFENPQYLIEILQKNGFVVTCKHKKIDELGNITAVRM